MTDHYASRDDPDRSWAINWTAEEARSWAEKLEAAGVSLSDGIPNFGTNVKVLKAAAEKYLPKSPLLGAIVFSKILGSRALEIWNNGMYFEYSSAPMRQIDVLKKTLALFGITPSVHMHLKELETSKDFDRAARNAIDFASRLGEGVTCVLHPGIYGCTRPSFQSLSERERHKREELLPQMVSLFRYAANANVNAVLENTSPNSDNMLTARVLFSPFKLAAFADEIDRVAGLKAKICLDIPHLFTGKPLLADKYDKTLYKLVEPLHPKVRRVHISSILPKGASAFAVREGSAEPVVLEHRHTPLPVGVVETKAREELANLLKKMEEEGTHEFFILEGAVNEQRAFALKEDLRAAGAFGVRDRIDKKFYAGRKAVLAKLFGSEASDDWKVDIPLLATSYWKNILLRETKVLA